MSSKSKNILIVLLLIGIISMTVAYATLSQQLNINGTARVQKRSDTWNIHFERVTPTSGEINIPSGKYTSVPSNSVITLDTPKTTATLPTVTFKAPGDTIEFYLDIVNEGEVTGVIDVINGITIPAPTGSTASDIEYFTGKVQSTMEYTNPQGTITVNDTIAQNETKHLKITLTLDQNVNMLPGSEITYSNITASIIYVQGTASNNSGSGSGSQEPQTPSNPYQTTFNGNYTYQGPESYDFSTSFSNDWTVYLRNDETKLETCGVFGNGQSGTVCMTSSYYNGSYSGNGYYSDFEDVTDGGYDITTTAGLESTGLKGYSLAKAQEMLTAGASYCDVNSSAVVCRIPSVIDGVIGSDGHVDFYDDNSYGACLASDGGDYCSY